MIQSVLNRSMGSKKTNATRQDVILEAWTKTGSQSCGASELATIQETLENVFGPGGVESPASLARTLADAGVFLRHPEVLQADSLWREGRLHDLFAPGELDFTSAATAFRSVERIEELRLQLASEHAESGIKRLRQYVQQIRKDLETQRTELSQEIVQWLQVWLQNPQIFADWLSLRRDSPDFRRKFGP
jgi:hypothetical protein